VHSLGLKLGIYQDIGTKTCIGYPGSQGYEKMDVDTFASWDVDYLKLDGCFMDPTEFDTGNVKTPPFSQRVNPTRIFFDFSAYPAVTQHLNRTGRPIVFSCSWPAYQVERKMMVTKFRLIQFRLIQFRLIQFRLIH
jgi:alpha-N-acetylgalactosaminidase